MSVINTNRGESLSALAAQPEAETSLVPSEEIVDQLQQVGCQLESQLKHEQQMLDSDDNLRQLLALQIGQFVQSSCPPISFETGESGLDLILDTLAGDEISLKGLGEVIDDEINRRGQAHLNPQSLDWQVDRIAGGAQALLEPAQINQIRTELASSICQQLQGQPKLAEKLLVTYFRSDRLLKDHLSFRRLLINKLQAALDR